MCNYCTISVVICMLSLYDISNLCIYSPCQNITKLDFYFDCVIGFFYWYILFGHFEAVTRFQNYLIFSLLIIVMFYTDDDFSLKRYLVLTSYFDLFSRECLVKALLKCGYTFQELMVSPTSVREPIWLSLIIIINYYYY